MPKATPKKSTLRTKVLKEMVDEQELTIVKSQIVKEYQESLGTEDGKTQAAAAQHNIDSCLERLNWLTKQK